MRCPFCLNMHTEVKDSRTSDEGAVVRRRRSCTKCKNKFTTVERSYLKELFVVKRSGVTKKFDREKIVKSITTALRKRPIPEKKISQMVDNVVHKIENYHDREIPTRKIGETIMEELALVDLVAYIRFASVYKDFSSAQDFAKFISTIGDRKKI